MKIDKKTWITGLVMYLVSTGISFATFSFLQSTPNGVTSPLATSYGRLAIDSGAPKDQECPLNGQMYTTVEREAWEDRRPLVIMVENSAEARPHSGIIKADVVYEAVAEGGVTRFMPVYYCGAQAEDVKVAPVRSVRTYFLDWASEYGGTPLFAHVGGANCSADKLPSGASGPCKTNIKARAIEQLVDFGWRYSKGNDLDQFSVGAPTYVRDETRLGHRVATEHSVVASTEGLWLEGEDRGWTNLDPEGVEWSDDFEAWQFQDDADTGDRGTVTKIAYTFWDGYGDFNAVWEYDKESNSYKRSTGGEPHTDLETGNQITAKNVVVLLSEESGPVDELKHILYETIGSGDALIFQNGEVIEATWTKSIRTGRTVFDDSSGSEIEFVRGQIWISVIDDDSEVDY
jgi:hypothetical protein